jgi:hypothetical protein
MIMVPEVYVGETLKQLEQQVEFNGSIGVSVTFLHKLIYYMRKYDYLAVPKFL